MSKKDWLVTVERVVVTEICCENCTQEEAETNPWDHVVGGETEIDQIDWEVVKVKENS